MTDTGLAQLITAIATLITSIGALVMGIRNSRAIGAVHQTTNGLSQRNEDIARKLGVEEGKKSEKANPS